MIGDGNNKIQIPWYRRNVPLKIEADEVIIPIDNDFNRPPRSRTTQNPRPRRPQPETQPTTQPETEPATQPQTETELKPFIIPQPDINPQPFPTPNFPQDQWEPKPFPGLPFPLPLPGTNGKKPTLPQPAPKQNPVLNILDGTIKPLLYLFLLREATNEIVRVNVTDPIYNQMLSDPVLGVVLREVDKANLDLETAATYFANYDYNNFDAEQMTKELTTLFGAAAAVRLIAYFVGRKVIFRM